MPDGSATAKAIEYSLNAWSAQARDLLDGVVSVDNNSLEDLLRPWAMGRKARLFAGSELAGRRAAIVLSLVHSVRLHGHDPYAYLRDVLEPVLVEESAAAADYLRVQATQLTQVVGALGLDVPA